MGRRLALSTELIIALILGTLAGVAVPARGARAETLVLYTSQPDRIASETVAAFRRVHPGTEIEVFRSGTTEVMSRLQAELAAGAPRPDLLLLADAVTFEELKAAGHLLALPEIDVAGFPAWSYDPGRRYFGTKLITTGIVYNTRLAAARPESWRDLLAPGATGQVVLPSPLYSGVALIHEAALAAAPSLGPGFYGELARHGAVAAAGNGAVLSAVAGSQKAYGIVVDFMALNAKRRGSPVDFVFPAEGVSAVTEPVAVLATTHHAAAARDFVTFLLSRDGQALAARQGFLPLLPGIAAPPGFPPPASLTLLPVDAAALRAAAPELKRGFAQAFGG